MEIPPKSLILLLGEAHELVHLAGAPLLLVAENLAVERDVAVRDREAHQLALPDAALDRVPRQENGADST